MEVKQVQIKDIVKGAESYWDDECDCGDIDCEGCKMKRQLNIHTSGKVMLDYYFPLNDRVDIRIGTGTENLHLVITRAGSCVRCGAFVLASKWDSHIQFHTNSVR